jgi:hypothetical protein
MTRLTLVLLSLFLIIGRNDGRGIDPNGGLPHPANTVRTTGDPDRGAGLDPNGRSSATVGDKGLGVDPNG